MLQIAQSPETTPRRATRNRPDPAFAAIQAHIDAMNAFSQAVAVQCELEETLPKEKRTWHPRAGEEARRPPAGCEDAPEWIAANISYWKISRANEIALRKFLRCKPTTVAGALAMLEHAGSQPYPEERARFKQKYGRDAASDIQTVMHEAFVDGEDAANGFHSVMAAVLRDLI